MFQGGGGTSSCCLYKNFILELFNFIHNLIKISGIILKKADMTKVWNKKSGTLNGIITMYEKLTTKVLLKQKLCCKNDTITSQKYIFNKYDL